MLALLVCATAVAAAGAGATPAADRGPSAIASGIIGSSAKLGPAQRRGLRRKLRRMRRVSGLEPRALKRFPGTFGGAWLDDDGQVALAFTRKPGAKVGKLRRSFAKRRRLPARRLDPVLVDDSLGDLRNLMADMGADRDADQFAVPYDLEIDLRANNVIVTFDQSLDVMQFNFRRNQMQTFYGDRAEDLVFRRQDLGEPEAACVSVFDCHDLRAGLETDPEVGGDCTTAFVVTPVAGMLLHSSAILSAAHCGNPDADVGNNRSHDGLVYGDVHSEVQSGKVDAELHEISSSKFGTAFSIYRNSTSIIGKTKNIPVVAVSKFDNLLVGKLVCRTGITTTVRCGKVLAKDYSPDYVTGGNSFVKFDACAEGGDSGGPVWQPFSYKPAFSQTLVHVAMATGIHSGGPSVNGVGKTCDDPTDFSFFSHITFVKKALGVKVLTPIGAL